MNGRSFRLFWLPVAFAVFASFFPDRIHYLWSLLASLVLYLGTRRLGKLLIRHREESDFLYFPLGLGIFLLFAYCIFSFTTGKIAICVLWSISLVLALFETSLLSKKLSIWLLWVSPFLLLGFWSSLTPATFFDALVYHLGLPNQYLLLGRMQIIPHHLYSAFPPFDLVLNILFAGVNAESGIKLFSIAVLFGIVHSAVGYLRTIDKESDFRLEHLVLPFLAIPSLWILVHLMTADLLTALFFSSGVFLLLMRYNADAPPAATTVAVTISAVLVAFSCWTKWNVLLYLPFFVTFFGRKIQRLALFFTIVIVLIAPLLVRNYLSAGDPLYPMLSLKLSNPQWSQEQAKALEMDSFPGRARTVTGFLLAPLELVTNPDKFGSASEIGLLPVFVILLAPFAAWHRARRLIIYIVLCFLVWLFVFPNFRQFIPVFVLIAPVLYFCWNYIAKRSTGLFAVALIVWGFLGLYSLLPIYRDLFPLIPFKQNRNQYLSANVRYFPVAQFLKNGKTILVGETRSAYFQVPLIFCTAYDTSPFEEVLRNSNDAQSFYRALKEKQVSYVVYDQDQFQRLSEKYGLWKISPDQQQILQEFVKQFTVPRLRVNGIYVLQLQ